MRHRSTSPAVLAGLLALAPVVAADVPPLPRGFSRLALSTVTMGTEPGTGAPIRVDVFLTGPVKMAPDGTVIVYTLETRTTYTAASPSYWLSTYTGYALYPQTGRTVNLGDLTATGVSASGRFVCGIARGTYDSRAAASSSLYGAFFDLGSGGVGGDGFSSAPAGYFPMGIYAEAGGFPYSNGLDVAALGASVAGDPYEVTVAPGNRFQLPAGALAGTTTQMQVGRTPTGVTAATVQRTASGGGTVSAGVFWNSLVSPGQFLPTSGADVSTAVTAITPGSNFVLGRQSSTGFGSVCYWTRSAASYNGPFIITDAPVGGFNSHTFLDGTDDGQYFVGRADGLFDSAAVINTPAATVAARSFFSTTFAMLPQPSADEALTSTDAVARGGLVFVGTGAGASGGIPVGPTYLWVFNRLCGRADVGSQGGAAGPDGVLDNNDFIVFIDFFFGHDGRADVGSVGGVGGGDGAWDNNDFVVFIDLFFAGC
ncbi:MAG TPA: GC-type dockerin domain-anchored protein [Phycisphaerales bacterium]|nr:GC-type dockerin domain-anchored protein [Phycisphaerales bacterium]